jgi:hypothetical protein
VPEAPTDGQQYARQSSAWSVVTGGGGGVSQTYVDTKDALRVLKAGDTMTGALLAADGLPTAPSFSFSGTPNMGMYNSAGSLAFSVGGAIKLSMSLSNFNLSQNLKGIDGTITNPGIGFGLEQSGLYRKSAGNVSLTVQSNEVISWGLGGTKTTTVFGPLVLAADPTTALQAATKQYVDAHSGGGGGSSAFTTDVSVTKDAPALIFNASNPVNPGQIIGQVSGVTNFVMNFTNAGNFDFHYYSGGIDQGIVYQIDQYGSLTINSPTGFYGSLYAHGSLTVDGAATFNDEVDISGMLYCYSSILLSRDPINVLEAATKQYVDMRTPKTTVGTTAPSSPSVNDVWIDTN